MEPRVARFEIIEDASTVEDTGKATLVQFGQDGRPEYQEMNVFAPSGQQTPWDYAFETAGHIMLWLCILALFLTVAWIALRMFRKQVEELRDMLFQAVGTQTVTIGQQAPVVSMGRRARKRLY